MDTILSHTIYIYIYIYIYMYVCKGEYSNPKSMSMRLRNASVARGNKAMSMQLL